MLIAVSSSAQTLKSVIFEKVTDPLLMDVEIEIIDQQNDEKDVQHITTLPPPRANHRRPITVQIG